jgi:tetraacyldisaccharide 4'-kinase
MNEAWHRQLISGELKGWRAAFARFGLSCLAIGYGIGARLRSFGFDHRYSKVTEVSVPVISIGNITAGGTGKTPFAAYVAGWFREHDIRVAFLSRGYGADPGSINDEALVLDLMCPDVPHLQNPDRVAAAEIAIQELESQLLILDDGFQHRRLSRSLDILLIDATNPWGFNALLPRGLLREPLSALRRASCFVLTRVDQVTADELLVIRERLERIPHVRHEDVVEVSFPSERLVNSDREVCDWQSITHPQSEQTAEAPCIAAFCGIGNPDSFRRLLEQKGIRLAADAFKVFPDHHRYTREDVEHLQKWATDLRATCVVTTLKDLVKLDVTELGKIPLWAAEITTKVHTGQNVLDAWFCALHESILARESGDQMAAIRDD